MTAANRIPMGIESDAADLFNQKPNKRERKLLEAMREDQNVVDDFQQALVVGHINNADGSIYTGATAEVLALHSGKAVYEVYQAAVAAAGTEADPKLMPYQSADGLELQPVAAADALELTLGTTSLSKASYTVGSIPGAKSIYFEATIKIDDISDVTEMFFGWRKAEAYQADPDSYADVAAFHIGATDDGRISITTSVTSTETVVDTTLTDWADGGTHTLRVEVSNSGLCKFLYDGAAPTVDVAGFSFPDAKVLVPFIHLNTETGDPGVSISNLEVGIK